MSAAVKREDRSPAAFGAVQGFDGERPVGWTRRDERELQEFLSRAVVDLEAGLVRIYSEPVDVEPPLAIPAPPESGVVLSSPASPPSTLESSADATALPPPGLSVGVASDARRRRRVPRSHAAPAPPTARRGNTPPHIASGSSTPSVKRSRARCARGWA